MSNNFDGPILLDDPASYLGYGRSGFSSSSTFARLHYAGADPNGVLSAPIGSLAMSPVGTWQNTDGAFAWVLLSAGSGGTADEVIIPIASQTDVRNLYFATTGSDVTGNGTLANPFATPQHCADYIDGSDVGGTWVINGAAGNYPGSLVARDARTTARSAVAGPNLIRFVGPVGGTCILSSPTSGATIFNATNVTATWQFENITFQGTRFLGAATQTGVFSVNSRIAFTDCTFTDFSVCLFPTTLTYMRINSSANPMVLTGDVAFNISTQSRVLILPPLDLTVGISGISCSANSTAVINSPTINIVGTGAVTSGITVARYGVASSVINQILNISGCLNPFNLSLSGQFIFNGGGTVNLTNCGGGLGILSGCSIMEDRAPTRPPTVFVAAGTTPQSYTLNDASIVQSAGTIFTAAGWTKLNTESNQNGLDFRYPLVLTANSIGPFPVPGTTYYFTSAGFSTGIMPLFIADQNYIVESVRVRTLAGNGPGANDVYTVYLNGVATTMSFAILNSDQGATTANPVTLAVGDYVGLTVVSDPLSAAVQFVGQLSLRRL